ncbi:MAG: DUF2252 family protein [Bdellovibrionaceae bacterium]|nr:DUF2252 family protein [Bdellovibrio sp.]
MKQTLIQVAILFVGLSFQSCAHVPHERAVASLNPSEIDSLWVQVGKNKDSMVRSNAVHFWAWMAANGNEKFGNVLAHRGPVTGDPHFFNFGDIHSEGGSSGLALIDIDDAGSGPLLLDFVRYSLFVKYYLQQKSATENFELLQSQMFSAYRDGLAKNKRSMPLVLQTAVQKSRKKLEKEHAAWVSEFLDDIAHEDYGLRKKALDLDDLSKISPDDADAAYQLEKQLLAENKLLKIYDIAHTKNKSGSSAGLNRFWFSILALNESHQILECKQLTKPATEYYEPQLASEPRIDKVLNSYSDFRTKDNFVMILNSLAYWCRPREFKLLKRGQIEKLAVPETKELALYFAHWLGAKQSLQPAGAGLQAQLSSDKTLLQRINQTLKVYDAEMDRLSVRK